jgi:two-component system LytT family response regulator
MTRDEVVTAVIVEDEPLACQRLRTLAQDVPWLEVVGEAMDGGSAATRIEHLRPALVFLDVRLPRGSGLEVLSRLTHKPAVIFTTAYDRFAVTAFEIGAIDYLVKPFGRERFARAVERARQALIRGGDASAVDRARTALSGHSVPRLFVREAGRIVPLTLASIERIQAADDYVTVHAGGRQYLLGVSLADLESRLSPGPFLRVHRSHLVNLDHVIVCTPREDSRFEIMLRSGTTVISSRQRSQLLRALAR